MMDHALVEYVLNCAWQLPLLASGAWLLVKLVRPHIVTQHCLWLAVLALSVLLPLRRMEGPPPVQQSVSTTAHTTLVQAVPQSALVREEAPASLEASTPVIMPHDEKELRLPWKARGLVLGPAVTQSLTVLFIAMVFIAGLRLARGLLATQRLVRNAREARLQPNTLHILNTVAQRLQTAVPRIMQSSDIDGPVVLCALRPVMVLPYGFEEHSEYEMRAVLCHELAHVRRRDYLVNLTCQVIALPVVWHPALYLIQQRIRSTREMACDAIAAEEMGSSVDYARCLVSLARQMMDARSLGSGSQAMELFGKNTMEERVMNLTNAKRVTDRRINILRAFCGCAAMMLITGIAATFHVRPAFAAPAASAESPKLQSIAPSSPQAQAVVKPSAAIAGAPASAPASPSEDEALPPAVAGKGEHVHRWVGADGKKYVIVNHNSQKPTQEERSKEEQKLKNAQKDLDELRLDYSTDNSLHFELQKDLANLSPSSQQMRDLQRQIETVEKKAQLDLASNPAWQKQMAEIQKKFNDPAWQKQMAELANSSEFKKFNDPEWQKQFAEWQKNPPNFQFNLDFNKQMAVANAQLAIAMNEAKLNETVANAMKNNAEQMAKLQRELQSGELKAKLDEATRLLEEVRKQMEAAHAK